MSKPNPSLTEKLLLADEHFSNPRAPMSGAEVRRLGTMRATKRVRGRAVAGCIALITMGLSVFGFGPRIFQSADQATSVVVSAPLAPNPSPLPTSMKQLQFEYDLIEAERLWLRASQRIEYQIRFPDSVADIASSNYSANKYLSAIEQSGQSGENKQEKLRQLVTYFPGTVAAESALDQIN